MKDKKQEVEQPTSNIMSREEEIEILRSQGFEVKETPQGIRIIKPEGYKFEYRFKN